MPSGLVVDFEALAPHLEFCQELSILSGEEAFRLAKRSVSGLFFLLGCPLVPEIFKWMDNAWRCS